jgi:Ca-activated chloride channel family protein
MKKLFLSILVCASLFVCAQTDHDDKVESPYFKINGANETTSLPLIATYVDAGISGNIANVAVKQIYVNNGKSPIEATYVFPGSTKSAVHLLRFKIEDRIIEAKVKEKQEAKAEYEKAKKEGKTATLMEQHRPNVFQMNVANIQPGDTIEVLFGYNELITPVEGEYKFVYPTSVGPRYVSPDGKPATWEKNPFANVPQEGSNQKGTTLAHKFDLNLVINGGKTIKEAKCNSHEVNTEFLSKSTAEVRLKPNERKPGKDFIFSYRLKGKEIEPGLILYENPDGENFFLYTAHPPKRVNPKKTPPREYIFIADVSGSMNGYPMDVSKGLMEDLFATLNKGDKFNVLLFAGSSDFLSEKSLPATEENMEAALDKISNYDGKGGTELLTALKKSLAVEKTPGVSRNIVMITDGFVTVEKEAFELIENNMGEANFFTFGIGSSVNRYLIEGLAHVGNGEPFIVANNSDGEAVAKTFANYIKAPVLSDIKVDFEGFDAYDIEPSGYGDIIADKPLVVFGKWKGEKAGKIKLTGTNAKGVFEKEINLANYSSDKNNEALKYLWARKKIQLLSDYSTLKETSELKEEITRLGIEYNLLTKYTSFIGVDNKPATSSAVHGNSGSVPEPHEWALILVLTLFMLYFFHQKKFTVGND